MAKIFYVTEKTSDYTTAHFFKTEKEALKYGKSQFPDFEMKKDRFEDDLQYDDKQVGGDWVNTPSGILFSYQEDRAYIQSSDDEEARKFIKKEIGSDGTALFFDKFRKGMYGTLGDGNGVDGRGFKWEWDGDEINESLVTTTRKKVLMFEEFALEDDCKCGGNCGCTTTTTNETNADGTISDDEDDDMENFFADVEFQVDELCTYIKRETEKIGGPFRSPGYEAQGIKLVKATFKKHKIKI